MNIRESEPLDGALKDVELPVFTDTSPIEPLQAKAALDQTFVNIVSQSPADQATSVSGRLGRYEILKKLGEGGMGAVFQAKDTITGQEVAIKVLAAGFLDNPDALRRFEKEARLLEEAKNPHVANLIDVGADGDTRFLVMEFIRGGDLRQWIDKRGTLDETSSLEIIGDLCRALVSAHAKGMIHRDIKPENILLQVEEFGLRPVVKLTDFGLARHVDQSDSLKLTQAGALLGTPYYMSPEQFSGTNAITPAADIYAIGATLFELLTGRRPFIATDAIQLAKSHCFDPPPDVTKLNPQVSDATADLVRRMLAKQPDQRPTDASEVLEEILRRQSGDSSQFIVHPVLPAHDTRNLVTAKFQWSLASSPAALWHVVGNTDRFNQAAGFQPVAYETRSEPDGRLRKFGQFKLAGIAVRWEEHPFEWVEGQRFSVLREFPTGPFVWFMSTVELIPRSDGGTDLKHEVKIEPRNLVGRILANFELGPKGQNKFTKIYHRIDNTIRDKGSSNRACDPFQEPLGLKRVQQQRLEERLERLVAAGAFAEVVPPFRELILNSSAHDIARLEPYAVARTFGLPEQETIEAFLHGASIGLFTLHWDIICPVCRLASDTKSTLREIEQHANCTACQTDFKIDFGRSLELIFRVHPEVRTSDSKKYCAGGPGNFPHVVAQIRMSPAEKLELGLSLDAGNYVVRGPRLPYAIPIHVDPQHGPKSCHLRCVPGTNQTPVAMLRAGHQRFTLENLFPGEQVIRIERTLHRSDALTASQVTTSPVFRQLFPDQTLTQGMLVEVSTANFLAIQMTDLDATFRELGDAATYSLMNDFWRTISREIHRRGGSTLDHSPGTVLSSFSDPVPAIEAACECLKALATEMPKRQWSLCAGLHRGPAIVTGDRQEVKYFGATINRTISLANRGETDQLLMTREVWSDPGVSIEYSEQMKPDAPHLEEESIRWISMNRPRGDLAQPRYQPPPDAISSAV